MWIVKNTLKATLSLRGLGVSISSGDEFDLDSLGRDRAEDSDQVQVAFEEGYLENVYKAPLALQDDGIEEGPTAASPIPGVSAEHFDARMEAFKQEVLGELRKTALADAGGSGSNKAAMEEMRAAISADVKELVGELKLVRERFANVKDRIQDDPSLSQAEVKARLAFLEEQERELLKNFETVGRQVEQEDGDVESMADLLADL